MRYRGVIEMAEAAERGEFNRVTVLLRCAMNIVGVIGAMVVFVSIFGAIMEWGMK